MNIPSSESALLKGLALNDRKSINTLYEDHYNMVQSLIINNNGTVDDARDIFQEAMIVLYEKSPLAKVVRLMVICVKTDLILWLPRKSWQFYVWQRVAQTSSHA